MRILLLIGICSLSIFDSAIAGGETRVDYSVGGDYYKTCRQCYINMLSESSGVASFSPSALYCFCGSKSEELTQADLISCKSNQSTGVVKVSSAEDHLQCEGNRESKRNAAATLVLVVAGPYSKTCNGTYLTLLPETPADAYIPKSITATCDGNRSTLMLLGNCEIKNGFYYVRNDHGQLMCG